MGSLPCVPRWSAAWQRIVPPDPGTDADPMTSQTFCRWATAREAREHLGVSEVTLARWRKSGLLKPGRDWRRKFPSHNSPVLYQLESCQSVMSEATARSVELLEPLVHHTQTHGTSRGSSRLPRRGNGSTQRGSRHL